MCLSAYPENYMVVPAFSPCPWVAMPPMPLAHMMPYPAAHMSMTPRKKQQYQQETGKTAKAAKATKAPKAPKVAKDFSEPLPTLPLTPSTAPPTPCSILLEDSEGESDHKCEKNSSDAALNRASRRRVRQRLRKKEGKAAAAAEAATAVAFGSEFPAAPTKMQGPAMLRTVSSLSDASTVVSLGSPKTIRSWSDMSDDGSSPATAPAEQTEIYEYYTPKVEQVQWAGGMNMMSVPVCAYTTVAPLMETEVAMADAIVAPKQSARELAIDSFAEKLPASFEVNGIQIKNTFVHFEEETINRPMRRRNSCWV